MKSAAGLNNSDQLAIQDCDPFSLFIGVICGSAIQIRPLLEDIQDLSLKAFIQAIEVSVLLNGETIEALREVLPSSYQESAKLKLNMIHRRGDNGVLPIGSARSILQKELGKRLDNEASSFGWILDDDMRIPGIAKRYLTWLPRFKSKGIDVLIGNFEGSSPNPPAHGIRIQLNDLLHNLKWFDGLDENAELPDRSEENRLFRAKYPDYYYDLSRKHMGHQQEPYWVIPLYKGETTREARKRIIDNLDMILTGEPFLRPLVVDVPTNPIEASVPSCNRGGNTFILNSSALKQTPNAVLLSNGSENRRSDMIWAIINRYYHSLSIHAVSFPVYHHRFINLTDEIDLDKTIGEIKGSAVYAALQSYFEENTAQTWRFSRDELAVIYRLYQEYIERRLTLYKENFKECGKLLDQIESEFSRIGGKISEFTSKARKWVNQSNLDEINDRSKDETFDNLSRFLNSIASQIKSF